MLENLCPYQIQAFYLLKDIEEKRKGGVFDPLLFGGKDALISLMMENFDLATRESTMQQQKKMRPQPKNTLIFSNNVNVWRTELERCGPDLRVLYREDGLGPKVNFHTTDIVVSNYLNLKQLDDRLLKSIKRHDWYRLVAEDDVLSQTQNNDTVDFILKLKVKRRWAVGKPEMFRTKEANILVALLCDSSSIEDFYPRTIKVIIFLFYFLQLM